MMHWDRLINDKRLGLEDYHDPKSGSRSDFQRDFDRLVFSSPFRRLQNKTQVFPLPGSIFVHNRLTHSMEVASVGRSLANEISRELRLKYRDEPWCDKLEAMGEIVSAACLAHDLGNPPFGHSGEKAISTFFSEGAGAEIRNELTEAQWADLINFEGNANSFRLLTHQFKGRRKGGFAMTYSMLASVVKYPYESRLAGGKSKFGFFSTEIDTFKRIAEELGLEMRNDAGCGAVSYARHPLVYIVEAADDICYQVMDIEDAHKLRVVGTDEVIRLFLGFFDEEKRRHMVDVMDKVEDPNEKIGYLRSCVIGTLVKQCARTFVDNEPAILAGEFEGSLLDNIALHEREGYRRCSALAWDKIYRASDVVDVELAGNRIITFLMEKLIHAVRYPELNYSALLLSKVPEQYDIEAPTLFGKIQAVLDHISGMTDVYALDLYRKLYGMSLPAV
ncbi:MULTISPECIES: dGTP triphosphohydrolase [Muribaculum]|uniref:dGTP triphosphohydrolase n=2 Tax=Muribaculaceae TaxID=2005473 RepID=UPI000F479D04|nr:MULTISPECIES: dNTP triphosphohydrolase [Muribaculum]MCX4276737.1 dNTP triphosphohydrolase [Muribaculum sp.]ROT13635.1 dNTP triphosphohydrolase [Muribaculaceae bacterium Isolate-102 (HZI)]